MTENSMDSIRLATVEDSNAIYALTRHLGYGKTTARVARQRLTTLLNSDHDKVWVCGEGQTLGGWIHIFVAHRLASDAFVEIGSLVVDPKYRRAGIGRALVEHAMAWAFSNHFRIRVQCLDRHLATQNFYQSVGFINVKSQHVLEAKV